MQIFLFKFNHQSTYGRYIANEVKNVYDVTKITDEEITAALKFMETTAKMRDAYEMKRHMVNKHLEKYFILYKM